MLNRLDDSLYMLESVTLGFRIKSNSAQLKKNEQNRSYMVVVNQQTQTESNPLRQESESRVLNFASCDTHDKK